LSKWLTQFEGLNIPLGYDLGYNILVWKSMHKVRV
jgi:hypothetical protein